MVPQGVAEIVVGDPKTRFSFQGIAKGSDGVFALTAIAERVPEIEECFGEVWLELERSLGGRDRFVEVAGRPKADREVIVRFGEIRRKLKGAAIAGDGLGEAAEGTICVTEIRAGSGVVWGEGEGALDRFGWASSWRPV